MPHLTVQIREETLDGDVEPKLIRALTDAVAAVVGEWARTVAVVELFGVPEHRWGTAGTPGKAPAPLVTLSMREGGLTHPRIPDAPARLIRSLTEAVTTVLGESVREHVTVLIVGVPAGQSGVGGEVV
ncbi:4-oxalocrotonate tautomerase family protein [Streptomyces sp. NBC_01136]|uniref:tautomerase family protein n=1 Tax=unclassified Streptomyces TaxID=2593676 RepID=UPI00324EC890|nr:4-oxalocrotonate tautomerase family protein [Streptomyces sp. NBC_01136]